MLRRLFCAAAMSLLVPALSVPAAGASPRPPLLHVLANGRIVELPDRLPADQVTQAGSTNGRGSGGASRPAGTDRVRGSAAATASRDPVIKGIEELFRKKRVSLALRRKALATWNKALSTEATLIGPAGDELAAAMTSLRGIAVRGGLRADRLAQITLTARRNAEFFARGVVPFTHQRVDFAGSSIVWQYYPGQGLQIQVLGTFGRANAMWAAKNRKGLGSLLDEMAALAVRRAGGLAWEYSFAFGGGLPPWTSAMSQATGIEAFTRGAAMLGRRDFRRIAHSALPLFDRPTPIGVRSWNGNGPWYVMYSFEPGSRILNGFLQSLIGLDEAATLGRDATAKRLFRQAEPVARAAVPAYSSMGWSFYEPGVWSTLDYHSLVTGFLDEMCTRTRRSTYCTTGRNFRRWMNEPPALEMLTKWVRSGTTATLSCWLSKPAQLTIGASIGKSVLLSASDWESPGIHTWSVRIPPSKDRSVLAWNLRGTDASGKQRFIKGTIGVGAALPPAGGAR